MKRKNSLVPKEIIENRILLLRGHKVILGVHLAELYGVENRVLNQSVKRNATRFPEDFMFRLTRKEANWLVSQNVIAERKHLGGSLPYVFTEQGVAMLSSVLNSERAIRVNIAIMRAFVKLRELLATHKDLARKLEELESKYDAQFRVVFEAIRELMTPPEKPKKEIGFKVGEPKVKYKSARSS